MNTMKTAVTVLQEMMVKLSQTPDYECISQSGPQHQAMFEYRCSALGSVVTAQARSKKEAKQEAARLMLRALATLGHTVPAPFGLHDIVQGGAGISGVSSGGSGASAASGASGGGAASGEAGGGGGGGGSRSSVALLQELCTEYNLPAVEYELVGDTGPPHLRHFTMAARVGQLQRLATATTKKAARQQAADQLYTYLRQNLARLTADFIEEDALVRAHEKAMERFQDTRDDARRPDLGQRIADYHLGLVTHIDADKREAALRVLEDAGADSSVEVLERALSILGLRAEATTLPKKGGGVLHVLTVDASPQLAFGAAQPKGVRDQAVRYLCRALRTRPPPPPPTR